MAPVNLQPANALRGLSYSTGSIIGPVLAGFLVAFAGGPGGAFLFDAATFVVSICCLIPLRPRLVAEVLHDEDPEASTSHFLTQLREGWFEVRSRPWVTAFLGGMASYHVIVLPAIFVLGPVLAARELNGASSWAIITAGFGCGLRARRPAPAALEATVRAPRGQPDAGRSVLPGCLHRQRAGVWAIAGLEVLAGVCVTGTFTLWETSLQEHIPDRALSRVSSYDYLTSAGLIPLGNLTIGFVTAAIGLHHALLAMTVLGVAVALTIASVPAVRRLPRAASAGGIASV